MTVFQWCDWRRFLWKRRSQQRHNVFVWSCEWCNGHHQSHEGTGRSVSDLIRHLDTCMIACVGALEPCYNAIRVTARTAFWQSCLRTFSLAGLIWDPCLWPCYIRIHSIMKRVGMRFEVTCYFYSAEVTFISFINACTFACVCICMWICVCGYSVV